jgi:hypothetical protein
MKKDFKTRIAEVAAKIAEIDEKYNEKENELPTSVLQKLNSSITDQKDLARAILDMSKKIIKKEPSMTDIETRADWAMIFRKLNQIAGVEKEKTDAEKVPDVSAADKVEVPELKEAFDRINRK